LIVVPFAKPTR